MNADAPVHAPRALTKIVQLTPTPCFPHLYTISLQTFKTYAKYVENILASSVAQSYLFSINNRTAPDIRLTFYPRGKGGKKQHDLSSQSSLFSLRVAMTQTCRKVRPATSVRARVLLMSGWQPQHDRGQAKLVVGREGATLLDKENATWQMSALSVFSFPMKRFVVAFLGHLVMESVAPAMERLRQPGCSTTWVSALFRSQPACRNAEMWCRNLADTSLDSWWDVYFPIQYFM